MALIAKPIVKNQLWVITDGTKKVGNIEANSNSTSYSVRIGDSVNYFSTTKNIESSTHMVFEKPQKPKKLTNIPFAKWPTDTETYNDFYDVKRKIHVYTKTKNSKCYYAAGYFNIDLNGQWQTIAMPKYIFIQRYPYKGPFITEQEATEHLDK